jgi:CheY-like chemotaxis protein
LVSVDTIVNQTVATAMLKGFGCTARIAADGPEVLDLLVSGPMISF